jgi:hypothetical protein
MQYTDISKPFMYKKGQTYAWWLLKGQEICNILTILPDHAIKEACVCMYACMYVCMYYENILRLCLIMP